MGKIVDITNKRFGSLIALRPIAQKKQGKYIWECLCDCSRIKNIEGAKLRYGSTKSCGCLRQKVAKNQSEKNKLPLGQAAFNALFYSYKNGAICRNYRFDLSKSQFKLLTQSNCYYCGIAPSNIMNRKSFNGHYIYQGIDRIDNNEDYILTNCLPCCWECNELKKAKNIKDFLLKIKTIYNHMIKNG
jgi:hypothetical protein